MRAKCFLAMVAALAVVAGRGASTRGEDLGYSDLDVRLATYEQSAAAESRAMRAAFLSDEQASPNSTRLVSHQVLRRGGLNSGLNSGRGDSCPECGMGEAWQYGPGGRRGMDAACGSATCGTCASGECASGDCGSGAYESGGCNTSGGESACECNNDVNYLSETSDIQRRLIYGEVQVMWLRAHVLESAIGKLSEQYEFSPRLVMGYEDPCGIGARLRYWHYDQSTVILGTDDEIGFNFGVVDAEVTSRFAMRKTDLVIAGGARWAHAEVSLDDDSASSNLIGMTFAADLRTQICGGCDRQWAGIAGARFSVLGGNWEGSGFVPEVRDDNVVVQELYGGFEYLRHTKNGHDVYARLTFEIQNWHSDAAAQLAGADSIGFVGPGIHIGGSF